MSTTTKPSFDAPDSTMDMVEKMTAAIVDVGGVKLMRVTAQPGWRWSVHSKPVQKTDSCQVDHVLYVVSGQLATKTDDGTETDYAAGDVAHVAPGHDGWTIGDEPAVWIEIPH
ncbi:cupin domain-containing protein [Microbacterium kribbense]|uniref:Cupin domain-containing protein n=1 Tax=Microbacterium kribbense TaxID=433645 RepID=A0ABP7GV72_9MICO